MEGTIAQQWFLAFMETVQQHEASVKLRDAAVKGQLREWTEALTAVVIATCEAKGWRGAARGHQSDLLPVPRQEYLAIDVLAFEPVGDRRWRFPVAVFELENSLDNDRVAYSLWKVLCVRAMLRVVFCYRRGAGEGAELVRHLSKEVGGAMGIPERTSLGGETLLVVGSRSAAETFPYGFFKDWSLDSNIARFGRG